MFKYIYYAKVLISKLVIVLTYSFYISYYIHLCSYSNLQQNDTLVFFMTNQMIFFFI